MATPVMNDVHTGEPPSDRQHHQEQHHQHYDQQHHDQQQQQQPRTHEWKRQSMEQPQGEGQGAAHIGGQGFQSADITFTIPMLCGIILFFCWLITMLVIESSKDALIGTVFGLTAPPFLIQATTFATAVCIAWYISQNSNFYLISAIFNWIVVCIWLLMIVEAHGFFIWRHSDNPTNTTVIPSCFFENPRPASYDKQLCDAYKAASIFSFFIMVVHFVWFVLHTIKAMGQTKLGLGVNIRGLLAILAIINIFAYLLWFAGRLSYADKYYGSDASLLVYIITLSVAICTLLTFTYISISTSTNIFFNVIWHNMTAAMLWAVVIFSARTTDNDSKVAFYPNTTDSGKSIAAAQVLMLIAETLSAFVFLYIKFVRKS